MRGRWPPQGWDLASRRESVSPLGGPPEPRCLIRALAGVSLEPQDFLSCGGKEREVTAGSWGPRARKTEGERMEEVVREKEGEEEVKQEGGR